LPWLEGAAKNLGWGASRNHRAGYAILEKINENKKKN